jgi:hypothetical protein
VLLDPRDVESDPLDEVAALDVEPPWPPVPLDWLDVDVDSEPLPLNSPLQPATAPKNRPTAPAAQPMISTCFMKDLSHGGHALQRPEATTRD